MLKKVLAILLALAFVATACSGSSTSESTDPSKETITLVANPWTASEVNAQIAKTIIEAELGNDVDIVDVFETAETLDGLSDGSFDAVLELWPSGLSDAENEQLAEGSVENAGPLGVIGRVGWFVPRYVTDEYPALESWEGYLDSDTAKLFATEDTGDQGRFLGIDSGYSERDAQIIENVGLPFEVKYSGSERATLAELEARVDDGEPVLLYWWEPTAAVAEYDLVKVELPSTVDTCTTSQATNDEAGCDYADDPTFKAVSPALRDKDSDVYAFLRAFSMTNTDQMAMLVALGTDGADLAAVAQKWVDENADIWNAWLPS